MRYAYSRDGNVGMRRPLPVFSVLPGRNRYGRLIAGLGPIAWFRYGQGITVATGVSQWNDASGNAHHLLQATGANQPTKNADGSITFNGTSHFLKCTTFTLAQPTTIYMLGQQISWTLNDYLYDGNTVNTGALFDRTSTPRVSIQAGTAGLAFADQFALGTNAVVAAVFNGASSLIQVGNNAAVPGDAGTSAMSGFTLGAAGNNGGNANMTVKEVVIFTTAHDAGTRAQVISSMIDNIGLN